MTNNKYVQSCTVRDVAIKQDRCPASRLAVVVATRESARHTHCFFNQPTRGGVDPVLLRSRQAPARLALGSRIG